MSSASPMRSAQSLLRHSRNRARLATGSSIPRRPSSVTGNIVRKRASIALTPAAAVGSVFTNGRVAIEGRLIDTTEKWSLFEFGDREKDKLTFYTLRDFKPYGHTRVAIREWAKQFEEMTRNPDWREMGDARFWTLKPW